ncbi:hypothetical protein [Flavobacterium sp. GT3R68]|uniref:hypothetical protein n=1 Tax=Flavobacterium sp. GT3R68 TaxID=2594437 RepID=UPI0011858727|nr:hypothetical protein [Flavobacterium sp. GT3R68]TRW89352.1 hypothetical protein FNW07_13465 [Flavobacterium sp. GT3R68]
MKNIIFILSFLSYLQANAQDKPYLTQKQNLAWVNNLKDLQLKSEKIDFIKAKIYSDTLYEKRIILDNSRDPEKHICQSLIVIIYLNKYYKIDLRENRNAKSIMKYISDENVLEIKILDYPENVTLYGTEGLCGVVTIYSNKKLGRKMKNVL